MHGSPPQHMTPGSIDPHMFDNTYGGGRDGASLRAQAARLSGALRMPRRSRAGRASLAPMPTSGQGERAMCDTDIAARRARDLERYHRRTAERRAKGLCLKCGKRPPAPHRTQCEPCAEKQRARDLERYHRRTAERIAKGLCPKCGKAPPEPGRSQCGPCLAKDAAAGRARDARLRAAGMPRRDPGKARDRRAAAPGAPDRRAPRRGALPGVRQGAARTGAHRVRTLR